MATSPTCELFSEPRESSCMNCWVKNLSLLKDLSHEELEVVNEQRTSKSYKAGEIIFEEGEQPDGLYCLHTGKVKIVKSGIQDNAPIVALKKPVNFFGLQSLMLQKPHSVTAVALEPCTVCIIKKDNFLKVAKNNSDLSFKIMQLLSQELEEADARMVSLTQKHLRARLADALLLLRQQYGTNPDNQTLDIQMKRADLAALANMTPANAIRILSDFSKENLLEIDKRKIKILQLEQIKGISLLG